MDDIDTKKLWCLIDTLSPSLIAGRVVPGWRLEWGTEIYLKKVTSDNENLGTP